MDMHRAEQVMNNARAMPGGMAELLNNAQFCAGYWADEDEQNPHHDATDDYFWWELGRRCVEA